ncbi:MAG TPA: cache domain-containing protein [Magnetospirillum sp.]|nr:cache domain-containing protein [Magnetospirillum sp.]
MVVRHIKALFVFAALFIFAALTAARPSMAEERATTEEAQALVVKAVELYKSAGREKALAAFADPNGGFMPKDLYIFMLDMKGTMILHAKNPGLNGKDLANLKDSDGKLFVAEQVKVASEKGSGWVDYKWVNAATKKIEPKTSFIQRADDVLIGCGAYKQ